MQEGRELGDMPMKKPEQMALIMSIVERGSGGKLVKLYKKNQVFTHIRFG